ncbi:MAG: peptidylprolyl isomerase [Rhizobiales bacterium]|nr:peptidylprolyl isomerase [Hyphomicrobiales bacterium]
MKKTMNLRTITLFAALVGGGALAGYASAQQAAEEGNVAVTVNGHKITAAEVSLAADDILPQIGEIPPNLRYAFVVEYLVERHLLAQEAVREKLIESDEYKKRIRFYQAKALRDALFAKNIVPKITEEVIKAEYEKQKAKIPAEPRARARHILVGTEAEAKDIADRLGKGANFEELAKKYSTDGSKDFGGDLGYFTEAEMVPAFSKAVFALKKGETSGPVKTDYGWHIIKLEDLQQGGAQPYERVKEAIKLVLLRKAVQDKVRKLRETGKIDILDPDLVKLQNQVREQQKKLLKKQEQGSGKSDKQ